jgi:predicted transcriptional regulator
MTGENGDGQIGDLYWSALAARVLHPAQVEIIEALWWIDQPLSATDLVRVFEGHRVGVRIERRLRQLARLDAVALEDSGNARGPMGQRSYRLVRRPGS